MPRRLTEAVRNRCRRAALAAADWFVRTQCTTSHPFTDANVGRFVYTYYMPTRTKVWGLSWTQGRAIFVLINALQLTKDAKYSTAIQRGALYLRGLQRLDPREPQFRGAIAEAIPIEHFCHPRDAVEGAEAMALMHRLTGRQDWYDRARLAADWFTNHVLEDGWPIATCFFDTGERRKMKGCWQLGAAKLFYQLYQIDRDRAAYERAVRPMCDIVISELQRPDGSMIPSLPVKEKPDHHSGDARTIGVCYNDDGAGVALLGAWRVLGDKRYRDAAVAFGDWMTTQVAPFPANVTLANFANLLLDLHRITRREHYLRWVIDNLDSLLAMQVRGSGDPDAEGAFRGEDEPVKWYFGGEKRDYVNTRHTAYAALALFKLHGAAFGPGYSIFGADKTPRLREIIPDKTLIG